MSYLRSSGQEQCEHILANFDRQVAKKSAEIGQLMYDLSMKDQQLQQYENNLENMARQIEFLAGQKSQSQRNPYTLKDYLKNDVTWQQKIEYTTGRYQYISLVQLFLRSLLPIP